MKFKMTLKGILLLGIMLLTQQAIAGEPLEFKSRQDKMNYGLGVDIARKLIQQGGEIDLDTVVAGMKHVLSGEKLLMTDEDIEMSLLDLQTEMIERRQLAAMKQEEMKAAAAPGAIGQNGKTELIVPKVGDVTTAQLYEERRKIKSRAARFFF